MYHINRSSFPPKSTGTVRDLLLNKIRDAYLHSQFQSDVIKPLNIEELLDFEVSNLSGGELQRVAIALCLGKPADVYLIDEPSAYLDAEQRLIVSKVIRRFILHSQKTAFIVEHDFIMATYMADKIIVFEGEPAVTMRATMPDSVQNGVNRFLKTLGVTFRSDPSNFRPRVNKLDSVNDREQKASGQYFYFEK